MKFKLTDFFQLHDKHVKMGYRMNIQCFTCKHFIRSVGATGDIYMECLKDIDIFLARRLKKWDCWELKDIETLDVIKQNNESMLEHYDYEGNSDDDKL